MLLSACTSNPLNKPISQEEQHASSSLFSPDTLHMTGRFAIRVSPNDVHNEQNHNNSLHGNFDWVQSNRIDNTAIDPHSIPEKTQVTLLSPFKQTLAIIDVTPEIATITQSGKAPQSALDADTLVAQMLGWPMPISGLRHWLQGNAINADGNHFTASPENNLVTTQDGWQIHYISWQQDDDENAINQKTNQPKRIDLTRTIPTIGEVTLRIMIDSRQ